MERIVALVLLISSLAGYSLSCNKGYIQTGWGQVEPVIILPKPPLLPKLKQAFHEGKLLVDYHKIVGPSLKPLPYKKGVGFIGLGKHEGWGAGFGYGGGLHNNIGYGYGGIGKAGFLGVKGEVGWGKKVFGPVGVGPIFGGGIKAPIGIGHEFGHHAIGHQGLGIGHGVAHHEIGPHAIGHLGQVGHTHSVSQQAVTVLQKGVPHIPHDPHLFHGKK